MIKRLQNKVAGSRFALPFMVCAMLAVCYLRGMLQAEYTLQTGSLLLATYLLAEMNNRNALLRIPSRMVSCSFLMLTLLTCESLKSKEVSFVQLLFIVALTIIFAAYQDRKAPGLLFAASACIGTASVLWVQMLFFVPVLWFCSAAFMLQLSWKNFAATLLGLLCPYWLLLGWYSLQADFSWFEPHFRQLADIQFAPQPWMEDWVQVAVVAFIALLMLTGTIHFLRRSYLDKIRTRFIFEMFIVLSLTCSLFWGLQPQHKDMLVHLLIVCVAPLIAHFIALTNTKVTNISFISITLIAIVLLWFTFHPELPTL